MSESLTATLIGAITAQYAVAVYCLPTLIALVRHHPNRGHIAVINMYLGWTVAGWVWALVAAIRTPPTGQHTGEHSGQHSGERSGQHSDRTPAQGTARDRETSPEQPGPGGTLTNREGRR